MSTELIDVAEQTSSYMDNAFQVDENVSNHVFGNNNDADNGDQVDTHSINKFRTSPEEIQGKAELYLEKLDDLKIQIGQWKKAENTANKMLWGVLSYSYGVYRGIYKASSRSIKDKIAETLREKLDEKGIAYNKTARTVTLTLVYAFGEETSQTKRYAQVLQIANEDNIDAADFSEYLKIYRGIDGVIANKRTGTKKTVISKEKLDQSRIDANKLMREKALAPMQIIANVDLSQETKAVVYYGVVNGANVHIISKLEMSDPDKDSLHKYFRNKLAEKLIPPEPNDDSEATSEDEQELIED